MRKWVMGADNVGEAIPQEIYLVLCKKSELFDYPSGFLSGQKATSPDKGRHERVRTRRILVGAVGGGRLQDLRR